MKLEDLKIETLRTMIHLLLWVGFFVAGFLGSNVYLDGVYEEKLREALGEALDETNHCIIPYLLDYDKMLEIDPTLNITNESKT